MLITLIVRLIYCIVFSVSFQATGLEIGPPIHTNEIQNWKVSLSTNGLDCKSVANIPETILCLADNAITLRALFARASYFVEGTPLNRLAKHHDSDLQNSPQINYRGHNLVREDLISFFSLLNRACKDDFDYCPNKSEQELAAVVFDPHRSFVSIIAIETGQRDSARNISHELLHARFSTIKAYREKVATYWHSVVSVEDKARISARLAETYNIEGPKGNYLLLNEFQAYVLQAGAETSGLGYFARIYRSSLRNHLKEFLE